MPTASRREVGPRIAAIRRARRMTQADLARAAYVSLPTIKGIERGARSPGDDTLDSIAAALSVDPSRIVTGSTRTDSRVHAALPEISAAVCAYDIPTDTPPRPLPQLAEDVDMLVQWRLDAQYARIAKHAPQLLADSLAALHHTTGAEQLHAAHLLAATARSADAVAYKFGARDLSARLADLMRWAAAQTEDRIAQATAAYVRTETFFAARAHTPGLRALEEAIDASPSPIGRVSTAARGALHMRAAVIAGRAGDADAATTHLDEARRLGDELPEDAYAGTQFGPGKMPQRILDAGGVQQTGPRLMRRYVYVVIPAVPGRWVRLRDTGAGITLCVKEIRTDAVDGTHGTGITAGSFEETAALLRLTGLTPRSYQENLRASYTLGAVRLEVDEWPRVPPYPEIEADADGIPLAVTPTGATAATSHN
jgi:transcriptional regulator with XRE-family HTH domain